MKPEGKSDAYSTGEELFSTEDAVELYTNRIRDPTLFPQERKAIEKYFTETEASVLDAGCGAGRVAYCLHERGFDVIGIDSSEPLLEKGQSLFPEIDLRVEDIRDTSFDSASFEYIVFSFYGLDYILPKAERINALREIYRLLKPGGIVIISSHNSWYPKLRFGLYRHKENRKRMFSRYKIEQVPLGKVEIYFGNPVHQWLQFRKARFTLLDVVGKHSGIRRFFERNLHYVAKK